MNDESRRLSFFDRTKQFHRAMPRSWPAVVKHVTTVLFTFAGSDDGSGITCSIRTLCEHAGEAERTIQRVQAFLRDGGFMVDDGDIRPRPGVVIPARRLVLERILEARDMEARPVADNAASEPAVFHGDVSDITPTGEKSDVNVSGVTPGVTALARGTGDNIGTQTKSKKDNQTDPISPVECEATLSPADAGRLHPHEVLEIWNRAVGKRLPKVVVLTDGREKKIRAFTKRYVKTASEFEAYVGQILKTPFLIGQNDRGWRASLDFAIRPDQYAKIIEGAYQRLDPRDRPYDYSQGPATPL